MENEMQFEEKMSNDVTDSGPLEKGSTVEVSPEEETVDAEVGSTVHFI